MLQPLCFYTENYMAITSLNHTTQKFIQLTEQSFLDEFQRIAENRQFISAGKFKAQLRSIAETIYNGAKSSGLDNETALNKIEETQKQLVSSYLDEYKQLLANNNQNTQEDVQPTENNE